MGIRKIKSKKKDQRGRPIYKWRAELQVNGHRSSKVCDSQVDAAIWYDKEEKKLKYGIVDDGEVASGDKLFSDAVDQFIIDMRGQVSPSQLSVYEFSSRPLLRFLGERKTMAGITKADILEYLLQRQAEVGVSSIRNELSLIRKIFEHAPVWGINLPSPEKDIKRPTHKKKSREDRLDKVISIDELNALLRSASFRRNSLYLYIRFLLFTGMRPSEACSLYWDRLPAKVEKEKIKNYLPVGYVDLERGGFSKVGTKTVTRFVPAHPEALKIIEYLNDIRKEGKKLVFMDDKYIDRKEPYKYYRRSFDTSLENAVIVARENEEKYSSMLGSITGSSANKKGILDLGRQVNRDISLYSFRHTFRSTAEQCGIPTAIGETIIGHETSFKFTYIHLTDDSLIEWIKKLDYPGLDPLSI